MKIQNRKNIFTYLLITFFILFSHKANSQGIDIKNSYKKQRFYLGISLGPSFNGVTNNGTIKDHKLNSVNMAAYSSTVDLGFFVSDFFGLSTGIGANYFETLVYLGDYYDSYQTYDHNYTFYDRRISGNNIKEFQKLTFLKIPVLLNFQFPKSKKTKLYFQTGISVLIPLIQDYTNTGEYSYYGYYPSIDKLYTDIPYMGFHNKIISNVKGGLRIKPVNAEFNTAAGIQFLLHKSFQFSIGVFYSESLSDISNYPNPDDFKLSVNKDQIKSVMEGCSSVVAKTTGAKLSLRYFF